MCALTKKPAASILLARVFFFFFMYHALFVDAAVSTIQAGKPLQQAVDTDVPAPITALSLFARFRSRQENTFSDRVLAALRREFGGHAVKETK